MIEILFASMNYQNTFYLNTFNTIKCISRYSKKADKKVPSYHFTHCNCSRFGKQESLERRRRYLIGFRAVNCNGVMIVS